MVFIVSWHLVVFCKLDWFRRYGGKMKLLVQLLPQDAWCSFEWNNGFIVKQEHKRPPGSDSDILFVLLRWLRQEMSTRLLFQLCVALALLNIFFIAAASPSSRTAACSVLAVMVHYFLLSTFFWTFVQSVYLYRHVVEVFSKAVSKFFLKACLFAWGKSGNPSIKMRNFFSKHHCPFLRWSQYLILAALPTTCWHTHPSRFFFWWFSFSLEGCQDFVFGLQSSFHLDYNLQKPWQALKRKTHRHFECHLRY